MLSPVKAKYVGDVFLTQCRLTAQYKSRYLNDDDDNDDDSDNNHYNHNQMMIMMTFDVKPISPNCATWSYSNKKI